MTRRKGVKRVLLAEGIACTKVWKALFVPENASGLL